MSREISPPSSQSPTQDQGVLLLHLFSGWALLGVLSLLRLPTLCDAGLSLLALHSHWCQHQSSTSDTFPPMHFYLPGELSWLWIFPKVLLQQYILKFIFEKYFVQLLKKMFCHYMLVLGIYFSKHIILPLAMPYLYLKVLMAFYIYISILKF